MAKIKDVYKAYKAEERKVKQQLKKLNYHIIKVECCLTCSHHIINADSEIRCRLIISADQDYANSYLDDVDYLGKCDSYGRKVNEEK